jgi:hypothetical protein
VVCLFIQIESYLFDTHCRTKSKQKKQRECAVRPDKTKATKCCNPFTQHCQFVEEYAPLTGRTIGSVILSHSFYTRPSWACATAPWHTAHDEMAEDIDNEVQTDTRRTKRGCAVCHYIFVPLCDLFLKLAHQNSPELPYRSTWTGYWTYNEPKL